MAKIGSHDCARLWADLARCRRFGQMPQNELEAIYAQNDLKMAAIFRRKYEPKSGSSDIEDTKVTTRSHDIEDTKVAQTQRSVPESCRRHKVALKLT